MCCMVDLIVVVFSYYFYLLKHLLYIYFFPNGQT